MRIKLTHLIGVSLILLSVVFSAISNASAAYTGGGAMEGNTTGGGVMDGNTTGGGYTVYKDNIDAEMVRSCYDDVVNAIYSCELEEHLLGGDGGQLTEDCINDAYDEYLTCMCSAGMEEACDIYAGLQIPEHTPRPNGNEVYEEPDTPGSLYDKYDQSLGNAKVDDQVAPATRAKTSRRPSPIIKAKRGVVKRRGR